MLPRKSRLETKAAFLELEMGLFFSGMLALCGFFERLDGFEDIFYMPWHFQTAPLFFDQAIGANQEGAALNAFDFLPYMILFLTTPNM